MYQAILAYPVYLLYILEVPNSSDPASFSDATSAQGVLLDDLNNMLQLLKFWLSNWLIRCIRMKDTWMIWSNIAEVTAPSYMDAPIFRIKRQVIWTLKILS